MATLDRGVGEDVAHFLVGCGEFERDRLVLLDDAYRIVGGREWLDESWRVDEEGKVELLLGKWVEGICNKVMENVGECIMYRLGKWSEKEAFVVWAGIGPLLSLLEQLDTVYSVPSS